MQLFLLYKLSLSYEYVYILPSLFLFVLIPFSIEVVHFYIKLHAELERRTVPVLYL